MDNLRNNSNRQRRRQKIHPANRRYSRYKCLNCGEVLRSKPRLINNEEVWQYCSCDYLNIFTWDSALNMIQRMKRATIDYSEFSKSSNWRNKLGKNLQTQGT